MKKLILSICVALSILATSLAEASPKIVYLISMPRSLTTAFERSMKARGDFKIVHEPFWQFNLKRELNFKDIHENEGMGKISRESKTVQEIIDAIDSLADSSQSPVFVKDFAATTAYEFMNNEAYVKRSDVQFVFLFREPEKTILSYFRMLRAMPEEIRFAWDPPRLMSYRTLLEFYQFVASTKGIAPVLIQADDLATNPKGIIEKVCSAVGIPFLEKSLHWEPGYQEEWHPRAGLWHTGATNSTGFVSTKNLPGKLTLDQTTEEERNLFEKIYSENRESYETLKSLATKATKVE